MTETLDWRQIQTLGFLLVHQVGNHQLKQYCLTRGGRGRDDHVLLEVEDFGVALLLDRVELLKLEHRAESWVVVFELFEHWGKNSKIKIINLAIGQLGFSLEFAQAQLS